MVQPYTVKSHLYFILGINERCLTKHLVMFDILYSGPVSEKPDEGLFFVDKETEEMRTTGMIHNYIYPANV